MLFFSFPSVFSLLFLSLSDKCSQRRLICFSFADFVPFFTVVLLLSFEYVLFPFFFSGDGLLFWRSFAQPSKLESEGGRRNMPCSSLYHFLLLTSYSLFDSSLFDFFCGAWKARKHITSSFPIFSLFRHCLLSTSFHDIFWGRRLLFFSPPQLAYRFLLKISVSFIFMCFWLWS